MDKFINNFFIGFLDILGEMSPYLLLGFFIAGILHVVFPNNSIQKFFGTGKIGSAVKASLFGIPLPLCSCGVIPTGLSLYKNGATKGSTISFLISTPQTGVDSILVTYSLLGLPFAIIRPIIAFFTGVIGGIFTNVIEPTVISTNSKLKNSQTVQASWPHKMVDIFRYGFVEFLQDISKWLVIGLILAAIITAIIPDNFFAGMGMSPILQMGIILLVSIPLYICATASIPLAAVLILKGVSPGAALVLLMAGPATNAATITMIGSVLGRKALFSYLGSIISGAIISGLIIDYVLPSSWFQITNSMHLAHQHQILPDWLKLVSGIVLIALIIYGAIIRKFPIKHKTINKNTNSMATQTINIEGMTCNHCKANVERNLSKLDFIKTVSIDLSTGNVEIDGDNIDYKAVEEAVNGLGYKYKGKL